jgi:hypothetical protein
MPVRQGRPPRADRGRVVVSVAALKYGEQGRRAIALGGVVLGGQAAILTQRKQGGLLGGRLRLGTAKRH